MENEGKVCLPVRALRLLPICKSFIKETRLDYFFFFNQIVQTLSVDVAEPSDKENSMDTNACACACVG
jgi:hypothetical protein